MRVKVAAISGDGPNEAGLTSIARSAVNYDPNVVYNWLHDLEFGINDW